MVVFLKSSCPIGVENRSRVVNAILRGGGIESVEMWPFTGALTNKAACTYQEVIIPVARHVGGCSSTLWDAKLRE